MPRFAPKKMYNEVDERTVYVILNPKTKEFFVGHTLSRNFRSTYKDQYIESKRKTAKMVHALKREGLMPSMFKLDELNCVLVHAYNYVIVLTKIIMERGYIALDISIGKFINQIKSLNIRVFENFTCEKQ